MGTLFGMSTRRKREGLNAAAAEVLNGERVLAGLTFPELAKLTGISDRQLKRLLSTHEADIDLNTMEKIGAVFRLSPTQVVAHAEERIARYGPEEAGRRFGQAVKRRRTPGDQADTA